MLIPFLIAVIAGTLLVVILMLVSGLSKGKSSNSVSEKIQKKGKTAIIKECQKKLTKNPHDVQALQELGDIYYGEKNWEKVYTVYKTLYDISAAHIEVNVAATALRMGIAAFNLQKYDECLNSLMLSFKKDPENYECNLYLGKCLYQKQIYDKAIVCLKKVKTIRPDSSEANEMLGLSLFKLQKYRDSIPFLKKVLDEQPDNKEVLYNMAIAMTEIGMGEKALKIFVHLRPDPNFGPQSCLECGKMHEKVKDFNGAIQDYSIALKLPEVPEQVLIQLRYRCAICFIAINDIPKALTLLKQVQTMKAGYKDVEAMLARYSELNQNKNLQVYMMAGTSEFIALCRKFISNYYKDAFVKVEDVQVQSENVDIVCDVEHPRWTAKQIFRFYRSQSTISDIYVRECHAKMRDIKCDKAICITLGAFSESAHKFIDGRPIDLIEKDQLSKMLLKINVIG